MMVLHQHAPKSWFHKTTPQCPSQSKHILKVGIQLMIVPNFSRNATTQLMIFILANFRIFQPEKYDFNTEIGFFWGKKNGPSSVDREDPWKMGEIATFLQ
jgi:hypothetical protein